METPSSSSSGASYVTGNFQLVEESRTSGVFKLDETDQISTVETLKENIYKATPRGSEKPIILLNGKQLNDTDDIADIKNTFRGKTVKVTLVYTASSSSSESSGLLSGAAGAVSSLWSWATGAVSGSGAGAGTVSTSSHRTKPTSPEPTLELDEETLDEGWLSITTSKPGGEASLSRGATSTTAPVPPTTAKAPTEKLIERTEINTLRREVSEIHGQYTTSVPTGLTRETDKRRRIQDNKTLSTMQTRVTSSINYFEKQQRKAQDRNEFEDADAFEPLLSALRSLETEIADTLRAMMRLRSIK